MVFPGGEDISPSLYAVPQPVMTTEAIVAERDVSDYLLMSYCLDQDKAVLGICRGMQMLGVVSGAEMIQDIPTYMYSQEIDYGYGHRYSPVQPKNARDFSYHDVVVTSPDSLLNQIAGTDVIHGVLSWHHQAVGNTAFMTNFD